MDGVIAYCADTMSRIGRERERGFLSSGRGPRVEPGRGMHARTSFAFVAYSIFSLKIANLLIFSSSCAYSRSKSFAHASKRRIVSSSASPTLNGLSRPRIVSPRSSSFPAATTAASATTAPTTTTHFIAAFTILTLSLKHYTSSKLSLFLSLFLSSSSSLRAFSPLPPPTYYPLSFAVLSEHSKNAR